MKLRSSVPPVEFRYLRHLRSPLPPFPPLPRVTHRCRFLPMKPSLFVAMLAVAAAHAGQEPARTDWIDADTGHRVVRLSDDAGGSTLYFHDNAFSPQGDTLM